MKERLLRIGILAGVLVLVNVAGRLVVRLGSIDDPEAQQWATLITYLAISVVMGVSTTLWARQRPTSHVIADLAGGVVAAGVLILTVGPFVSGTTPAQIGAGDSFNAAWQYAGYAAGGAAVGLLLLIVFGKDYVSQGLRRFAEAQQAKPSRAVRR